jgi:hypothetical protein
VVLYSSSGWALAEAPYVFVALGLIATLLLFWSVKRDMQYQTWKQRRMLERITARLEEAAAHPETGSQPLVIMPAVRSGFNINRRVQAMRLLRWGEDISHIAAALNVPRREVELLIRVQQLPVARAATLPEEQTSATWAR